MAMDFFASQAQAESRTRLMLALFIVAVACIALSFNLVSAALYLYVTDAIPFSLREALDYVPRQVYWGTTAVVLVVIAGGSFHRMSELWQGGTAVAELLGGRRLRLDSTDPGEQRLINVVEEMAIASGIVMPAVYVLDEQGGINAFAAGYSPNEAAIAVTGGALRQMNRDELQGVIAHEFSHILNGDMRLNIRLIGVIAGIVTIGNFGRFLIRLGMGNKEESSRNKGDLRVVALGIAIWLIGSIGVLFGTLIKAAISRQREFLADAAAVQFTRNPEGIAGALFRISRFGGNVHQRHADEISHMCISAPNFTDVFATHPPLEERIRRLVGPAAAVLLKRRIGEAQAAPQARQGAAPVAALNSSISADPGGDGIVAFCSAAHETVSATPARTLSTVGQPTTAHLGHARRLMQALPAEVRRAVGTLAGARAALFALVLGDGETRGPQLDIVAQDTHRMMADQAANLAALMKPLGIRMRMPVYELAMASLRTMDTPDREATLATMARLVGTDGCVTLGEFVLLTLCRAHLKTPSPGSAGAGHDSIARVSPQAATLLSLLLRPAQAGGEVYARVAASLGLDATRPPARNEMTPDAVENALTALKRLAPREKAALVAACIEITLADGQITITEAELLRAICAALDVPLPPLLAGFA